MCIISFNAFKNSLANMNPGETRQFLDDIFGFKTFTEYNDQIIIERKWQITENTQLNTILNETRNQIDNLKNKRLTQTNQLQSSINIDKIKEDRQSLINKGLEYKNNKIEKGKEKDIKVYIHFAKTKEILYTAEFILNADELNISMKKVYYTKDNKTCEI